MGLFDVLTGKRKIKKPAPDRLFAMSTAGVTLDSELGLKSAGKAAIVFQPLGTADFDAIVADMEELVKGTGEETGTVVDKYRRPVRLSLDGARRPRLRGPGGGASTPSRAHSRPAATASACCAAVFAFRDAQDKPVYWIYNYKRGAFYPFVPAGGPQQRDSERELRLQAQIGAELPVEAQLERWFPLWGIPI